MRTTPPGGQRSEAARRRATDGEGTNPRGRCQRFETALGPCAIGWTARGVCRLLLPGHGPRELESEGFVPAPPPAHVTGAIGRIRAHLGGAPQAFDDVALDLGDASPFARAVYEHARRVPSGTLRTYGEVAADVGRPAGARAVGQVMGRNPIPIIIPCHRIVAAGGKAGGFSAPGGIDTKVRLLALEGVQLRGLAGAQGGAARPSVWTRGALARAVTHLRSADPRLRRVIEAVGPCRLARQCDSVYESLCVSIIHQQLAGAAAAAITRRFMALLPAPIAPHAVLEIDDATYRAVGLSAGKVRTLRALSRAAVEGRVQLEDITRMTDDEASKHLITIPGIGPWTVQMLLIFHLGRPDVLPVGDLGIRKAMQRVAALPALPTPLEMATLAERWRPWRTVAMWYLWRSLDLPQAAPARRAPRVRRRTKR